MNTNIVFPWLKSFFKNYGNHSLIFIFFFLTSCAPVARLFSTPTYSLHNSDKIYLNDENKIRNVFVKKSSNKNSAQSNITNDVETKLKNSGIKVVSDINSANYILSVNIKNIATDIDYNFANSMRNMLLSKEINSSYIFDANNMPHINTGNVVPWVDKNNKTMHKRLLPHALYSLLGSGVGFTLGFTLAGSHAPFAFGILTAIAVGGATFITYDCFRKVGVIIGYDVVIDERNEKTLDHNRKILTKKSSNSSDETYYSYKNNWNTMTSNGITIAIGSRALIQDMKKKSCQTIANNITEIFATNGLN